MTDEIKKKKKKKNKNKNKKYRLNVKKSYKIEGSNHSDSSFDMMIYPTESASTHLTYAKTGRTKGEIQADNRVKKFALEREKIKSKEDSIRYKRLVGIIGNKEELERVYSSYFKNDLDTLDFVDVVDRLIDGKDIRESDLVFIREYLYKTLK